MFLKPETLATVEVLHTVGQYIVIENVKREVYEDTAIEDIGEEHLPNYMIVNNKNGAIEFATDQFPSACQIAGRLDEELSRATEKPAAAGEIRMVN